MLRCWYVVVVARLVAGAAAVTRDAFCLTGPTRPEDNPVDGCWPAVFVIGAQKAGSTTVYDLLKGDLGFCGSSVHKETHYWPAAAARRPPPLDGLAANFTRLFPRRRNPRACAPGFVEATPANLRVPGVPALLRAALPDAAVAGYARFVAILREPVARDLSAFPLAEFFFPFARRS